jgi:copper homeostasis protein
MAIPLEVPIFGPAFAVAAVSAGASRLELNAQGSYPDGGLTPSIGHLASMKYLSAPIRIMIRPRGPPASGACDFIYTEAEVEAMLQSICDFKASGLMREGRGDGFVFGALAETKEGQAGDDPDGPVHAGAVLNIGHCSRLVDAAKPFKVVFHRAFDELVRFGVWQEALAELVRLGFDGILTSGGPGDAVDNVSEVIQILEKADNRIEIILGGGLRSSNIARLRERIGSSLTVPGYWAHSSCLTNKITLAFDTNEAGDMVAGLQV